MAKLLTVRSVAAARPGTKRREVPDAALPGLHLVVQPSGAKSWAVRYRFRGRSRKLTLGSAKLIDLVAARTAARRAHEFIAAGEDPALVKKRRSRETTPDDDKTFEVIARRFIERYAKPAKRRWRESERILEHDVVPRWGARPIASITRPDVVALLDSIVDRGSPIMANRVLSVVRKLFNWCIERGTLEASPCDRIKAPGTAVKRDRVHSDAELSLIWRAARATPFPHGPYAQLLILTAQRRQELGGLRWSELDPELTTWTLPAARAKNGVLHEIPLSEAAAKILAGLPRFAGCDYVFTTTGPIAGYFRAKRKLDRVIAELNDGVPLAEWRFHDFRRTAASGMARLKVQLPVVEKILAHTGGSFAGTAGVYQRHDFAEEKRDALERWSRHVLELAS